MRAANDVIWDWDARDNDAEWSEALRTVFGWDPQVAKRAPEGTHCWWSERVHPEDRARVIASYDAAIHDPKVDHWEEEYRFRRADDGWAVVIDRAFLLRDGDGGLLRAVGAMQDVSARTAAMAALRDSEARFRALMEAVTSAVWRTEADGAAYDDSAAWRAITGMTSDEARGHGWMRAIHPEDVARSRDEWRRASETRSAFEVEHRLRTPAGAYRWFLSRGVPVLDEPSGDIREWVGMHQDVDDRRRRESSERWLARATLALHGAVDPDRMLLDIADLALDEVADVCVVHMAGADGALAVASIAARDAARGEYVRQLLARFPDAADASAGPAHVLHTGTSVLHRSFDATRLESLATDAEHLTMLERLDLHAVISVPIAGHAAVLGVLSVAGLGPVRDRVFGERELLVAEELGRRVGRAVEHAREFRDTARARVIAEAASQAKSDFLAVLSHEIRTPLNAIVGYGQLLAEAISGPVSDDQRSQLKRIVSSAEHLRALIDEVLTLSRMEAGREAVRPEPVDLCALVDEAIDIVALAAQAKKLRLVRDVPASGCMAQTDRTKLLQAVVNLAGNAVKFTDEGEVSFTVRRLGARAEIEVRDTGVGIAPEHQQRIYEPFWQVDQHAAQSHGGTGLGLSVVRHVMELLGGGVRAESFEGAGSAFTVWIPVESG